MISEIFTITSGGPPIKFDRDYRNEACVFEAERNSAGA
jgi:hypothetical protein